MDYSINFYKDVCARLHQIVSIFSSEALIKIQRNRDARAEKVDKLTFTINSQNMFFYMMIE